jgi:hypothetical protein
MRNPGLVLLAVIVLTALVVSCRAIIGARFDRSLRAYAAAPVVAVAREEPGVDPARSRPQDVRRRSQATRESRSA